jgi:hypothetical protein
LEGLGLRPSEGIHDGFDVSDRIVIARLERCS